MSETTPTLQLPNELPVVPLRGAVVLPMTVAPLGVSRPTSVEAVNKALAGDRMVLLLLQTNDNDDPAPDDLHRVGTVAIIRQMAKGQGGMRVLVEGVARARAEFLQTEKGYLSALIKPLPEHSERSLEIDAHVIGNRRRGAQRVDVVRPRIDDRSELAYILEIAQRLDATRGRARADGDEVLRDAADFVNAPGIVRRRD